MVIRRYPSSDLISVVCSYFNGRKTKRRETVQAKLLTFFDLFKTFFDPLWVKGSFSSRPTVHFSDSHSFSLRHYPPICQPAKGVYLLTIQYIFDRPFPPLTRVRLLSVGKASIIDCVRLFYSSSIGNTEIADHFPQCLKCSARPIGYW